MKIHVKRQTEPFGPQLSEAPPSTLRDWAEAGLARGSVFELRRAPDGYRAVFAHLGVSGRLGPERWSETKPSAKEALEDLHRVLLEQYPHWVPKEFGAFTIVEEWTVGRRQKERTYPRVCPQCNRDLMKFPTYYCCSTCGYVGYGETP